MKVNIISDCKGKKVYAEFPFQTIRLKPEFIKFIGQKIEITEKDYFNPHLSS